jgi:hypothetical protein
MTSRADAERNEVKVVNLRHGVLGWGHHFADQVADYLRFDIRPDLRWLRRSAPTQGVFFHSTPGEVWIRETDDLATLADTIAHELRHARQFIDQRAEGADDSEARRARDEAEAQRFGLGVRDRILAGAVPIVDPSLPKMAPLPPVSERSPVPTARTATPATPARPGVIVTPPRWQADRVPITVGGRKHFRCDPCGQLVAVSIPHACRSRRHVSGGIPDDT